ncbi:MAG TPA: glycoside hydrolase 100 family protein [Burkholderiales bacterium]|nr:glycoside hydrolase 100 family protein [Burkholderiales bacterium]
MKRLAPSAADDALLEQCRERSVRLLRANLTPAGVLAASRGARARRRGYCAIFGRDASLCAIGMAISGDARLERGAAAGLATLAAHQSPEGQIPNIVDARRARSDFWYLGCIDATLWWLIALAAIDRARPRAALRRRFAAPAQRALAWLRAQEHPRFRLLQQNEASDWADIMPRSGYVLYSNALWHLVKLQYGLDAEATRKAAARLLMPFTAPRPRERRLRILSEYAKRIARDRGLYLSYVNYATCGDEGDAFGNALAVLCGLAPRTAARRIRAALERAGAASPYALRVVCEPIAYRGRQWRPYMARHGQNFAWRYQNGGVWPFAGALWAAALAESGDVAAARAALAAAARANALGGWAFNEWLHGRSFAPGGMRGQSWNAAAFLIAHRALREPAPLFRHPARRQNGS